MSLTNISGETASGTSQRQFLKMYLQVTGCGFFRCDMPQEKHREPLCFCSLLYRLIRICLSKKQLKQQLSKGHKYLGINSSAPELKYNFFKKVAQENARVQWVPYHMSWWAGRTAITLIDQPGIEAGRCLSGELHTLPLPKKKHNTKAISLMFHSVISPLLFLKFII